MSHHFRLTCDCTFLYLLGWGNPFSSDLSLCPTNPIPVGVCELRTLLVPRILNLTSLKVLAVLVSLLKWGPGQESHVHLLSVTGQKLGCVDFRGILQAGLAWSMAFGM